MDQLTRIATALERIADALEKQNEPSVSDKSMDDFMKSDSMKYRRDARGRLIKPKTDRPYLAKADVKYPESDKKPE